VTESLTTVVGTKERLPCAMLPSFRTTSSNFGTMQDDNFSAL